MGTKATPFQKAIYAGLVDTSGDFTPGSRMSEKQKAMDAEWELMWNELGPFTSIQEGRRAMKEAGYGAIPPFLKYYNSQYGKKAVAKTRNLYDANEKNRRIDSEAALQAAYPGLFGGRKRKGKRKNSAWNDAVREGHALFKKVKGRKAKSHELGPISKKIKKAYSKSSKRLDKHRLSSLFKGGSLAGAGMMY